MADLEHPAGHTPSGAPDRAQAGRRPYGRGEFNRALVVNALIKPLNVIVLATVLIAGVLLGVFAVMIPVALVVYGIAVGRTYFDSDEADAVLARERAERGELEAATPRADPRAFAAPIGKLLGDAFAKQGRINEAIERAELPYGEVSAEVDRFVAAIEQTAGRAQLLFEALEDSPPSPVEARLKELRATGDPAKAQLVDALEHQLEVLRRMETQLDRFYDEMERLLIELDTVRGSLVSVSASTDAANQEQLAAEVRGLREEVGAVAAGIGEAYERPDPAGA